MKKVFHRTLVIGLISSQAFAGSVNVQTHVPVGNSSFSKSETASGPGTNRFLFALDYNLLNDPLVELNPTRERRIDTLIDGLQTLSLTGARDFGGAFALGATVPVHLVHAVDSPREFAMGDVRLFGKVYLLGSRAPFRLSLIPEVTLPTGDASKFLSDSSAGYGAMLAAEKDIGSVTLVANAGYRANPGAIFREMDYRQKIPLAIGAMVPVARRWAINVEAAGNRVLPLSNRYNNPAEFYGGARYQVSEEAVVTAGASVGATNQVASADYRLLLGFRFSPFVRTATRDVIVASKAKAIMHPDRIELGQEIRFAHDSAEILPVSKPMLDEVARILKQHPEKFATLDVEGHCNELGSDLYNLDLSRRRAASVRMYLTSQGVEEARLHPVGYGKRRPKPGSEKMDREHRLEVNRRVEFKATQTM
jgi:outer membrane protein OmpA-like peptidoglycan-associated protein